MPAQNRAGAVAVPIPRERRCRHGCAGARSSPPRGRGRGVRLDGAVFAYARSDGNSGLAVALNFSDGPQKLPVEGAPILSTEETARPSDTLRPHEGVILATRAA